MASKKMSTPQVAQIKAELANYNIRQNYIISMHTSALETAKADLAKLKDDLIKHNVTQNNLIASMMQPLSETTDDASMRTTTDTNIRRLMKAARIDWETAWTQLRCYELEDGASICCSEECEEHDSAIDELVEAAQRGEANRRARHAPPGAVKPPVIVKAPDVPPPRVRDADNFWPFMRCKNVARALNKNPIPRSHSALLEYIAATKRISVAALKNTSPHDLFKDNANVMRGLHKVR